MLKDEIKLLLQAKSLSKQERKYLAIEYEEVKELNQKLKSDIRQAKKTSDIDTIRESIKKIDNKLESELRNRVNDTVQVKYRNTAFEVDKNRLDKMKDPDKYLNKLYYNRTMKQIGSLIKNGKITEAEGLLKVAKKSLDNLTTDKRKEKLIESQIESYEDELGIEEDEADDEKGYEVVFISSGSGISVVVI